MIKHSTMLTQQAAFAVCCFILFFASSCKSAEKTIPEVDALSVLEEDSSVYFRIPVASHAEFVKKLLCSAVEGLTEDNADLIIPKIDTICAGIGSEEDAGRVQLSAAGMIPPVALKTVFKEKHGWKSSASPVKSVFSKNLLPYTTYSRANTDYVLSLPALKNIVMAKNIVPLLERYNKQYEAVVSTGLILAPSDAWTSNTYEWMTESTDDIRFCVLRPQAFLAALLGTEMRFALVCARGKFVEKENGVFTLSLELEFENSFVVKAASAALRLAFGSQISISQPDPAILKLSDINFTQDKILQLFGQQIHN